jgi:hypothetical protein
MVRWRHLPVLVSSAVLGSFASAFPRQTASCCVPPLTPPGASCCIGQWEGPYDLGTSCADDAGGCQPFACATDEIAHAALIPTGSWPAVIPTEGLIDLAGQVVFWTTCTSHEGYATHVWNPARPDDPPVYHPEILSELNPNGPSVDRNGPFCSGHAWVLDEAKNPKLLTVGGVDGAPFESGSRRQRALRLRTPQGILVRSARVELADGMERRARGPRRWTLVPERHDVPQPRRYAVLAARRGWEVGGRPTGVMAERCRSSSRIGGRCLVRWALRRGTTTASRGP